jgi:hypothetical protein
MNNSTKTAFLLTYGAFFSGLFLIMVSIVGSEILHWPVALVAFVRDVGLLLSAVVASTLLHEKLLRDEMVSVVAKELEQVGIPNKVYDLFLEKPPGMTGLKQVSTIRSGYDGYYEWVLHEEAQELFLRVGRCCTVSTPTLNQSFPNPRRRSFFGG